MDTLKISLWLFLVLSSATISKSKTLKYNAVSDNCFCFNTPGKYKKVPDIMNQDENNLERIAVHFYKLKNTGEIKMYIPNSEKQALIPHLAFEVGDKLNTVNENDSANRLLYLIFGDGQHLPTASQIDNTKVIQPAQDWIQEHPQANNTPAKDNIVPYSNDEMADPSEEQTTSDNEVQTEAIPLVNNIDHEHDQDYFTKFPFTHFNSSEKDLFDEGIIIHTLNKINNNDLFPNNKNNIQIHEIPQKNKNVSPDSSDVKSPQENNVPVEPLNTDKHLSELNIEPDDDHESYNEEHNETNDVSPAEETSTTRYDISPTDVYEQQNPDIKEIMSIKKTEPGNAINDTIEIKPLIENDPQKTIDGGNKHWHVEEITEPATSEHTYNVVPEDVFDIHFPHREVIVPIEEQNKHPHVHSNDQDSYKDTIAIDEEKNRLVTINFSEEDINKDVVDKQPGGHWTPHENNENLIHINHTQPNPGSSGEEHESIEIPFTPHVSDENFALDSHHHHHHNYETFERWFAEQMKRFKTYTEHDRTINLQTIERYILKILHDNGMHVTAEGVLADSFGTALDVRKLNLRPIFIGDTVTLGKLFEEKKSELVLPTNKAYLQAILVTNSEPLLMLGIIPIGKTIIPPSTKKSAVLNSYVLYNTWGKLNHGHHHNHDHLLNHGHPHNHGNHHNHGHLLNHGHLHNHGHHHNHGHYYHHPKNEHQRWYNELSGTPIHTKIWNGFTVVKNSPPIKYKLHEYLKPIRFVKSIKTTEPYNEETVISEDSVESTNKLITTILEDNYPASSVETTNELLANSRNDEGPLPTIPINPDEGDIGDDLEPRIVGGQPATSSGIPLNIKGRMSDF